MVNYTIPVRKIRPLDYDVFLGMDVDKRSIVALQIDHHGNEKQLRMPYNSTALLNYLSNNLKEKRVVMVYEAGPTGFGLADDLLAAGYNCLVVNPAQVPTAVGQRVRTNRLDAQKLARQLRSGNLVGVQIPGELYRYLRELVTLRKTLITESAKYKQRIKALFLLHGLSWPENYSESSWSNELINKLYNYPCNAVLQFKIQSLVNSLLFSRSQALTVQKEIRRYVASSPELSDSVRYAMSIPGIGWIVATYMIARVGDYRNLGTSNQTASFLGLVQTESSTGDSVSRGSITKSGDPVLRSLLIEAAWTTIRLDPELAAFYHQVKKTHSMDKGSRIAIVAVARKLVVRLHCVLKERRVYQVKSCPT